MIDNRTLDSLSLIDAVMPDVITSRKSEALTKQAQSSTQNSSTREGTNANGDDTQVNSLQGN